MFQTIKEQNEALSNTVLPASVTLTTKNNVFDELWFTAFSITIQTITEASRCHCAGMDKLNMLDTNIEKLQALMRTISEMDDNEYLFQMQNSIFNKESMTQFRNEILPMLTKSRDKAYSVLNEDLQPKYWLVAEQDVAVGLTTFNYRVDLIRHLSYYTDDEIAEMADVLYDAMAMEMTLSQYLSNHYKNAEKIKAFFNSELFDLTTLDDMFNTHANLVMVLDYRHSGCKYYECRSSEEAKEST